MQGLPEVGRAWQFSEGDKVRIRHTPDWSSALVLRRIGGLPFPHYEVMDDEGYLVRVAQIELLRLRP
jgi:hypothetical protein